MAVAGADQLLARVLACQHCQAQLPLPPRPVIQFHPDARLLIVGQAPGRLAHQAGRPFADPSGDRLRAWLGIDSTLFYDPHRIALLPMGFCFPGSGSAGDRPPLTACAALWREALLAQLNKVELTILLGRYAQAYHLPGKASVSERVSEWQRYWPDCIPLPHPSPRNSLWLRQHPWFETEILPVLRARVQQILFD